MPILILSMPVLHQGYLDMFGRLDGAVGKTYLLDDDLVRNLSEYGPDIAALPSATLVGILNGLGYPDVSILKESDVAHIGSETIILVNEQVSRSFHEKYLPDADVRWENAFLRWDRDKVLSADHTDVTIVSDMDAERFMDEAYAEGEKSGDWWRQVGAVLVKDGEIVLRGYNAGVPDDHEPYKRGSVRDFLEPGERPDLAPTIHAEQSIIATAARKGIALEGAALYVTHFPCSVCAKLISRSGIRACYFGEGSSNLDGKAAMESAGIGIFLVKKSGSDIMET